MSSRPALAVPSDILRAFVLLSRVPMPRLQDWSRQARAAWAYPFVGLVLGLVAALAGALAAAAGLPAPLVALLVLAVLIGLSGAMHEDGLADTADGFWGGWTVARRLEIMKDSQIGSYGVIALILSLGARWAALSALWAAGTALAIPAVIVAAVLSRAAMTVPMHALPNARGTGVAHGVGAVPRATMGVSLALAGGLAVLFAGGAAVWCALAGSVSVLGLCHLARRKIGGYTGDVLGSTQQTTEIVVLLCLLP